MTSPLCRETLTNTETYKERERKRQQHLEEIVNAPKPEPPPNAVAAVDVDDEEGQSNMEEEDGLPEYVLHEQGICSSFSVQRVQMLMHIHISMNAD